MAQNVSGFGFQIRLTASKTYPNGITLTQFADDADPFDLPALQIRDKAMGLNGDLVYWSKANPLLITINLIPAGEDNANMDVLLEANRVGKGKLAANDIITLVGLYPDGRTVTMSNGVLTDGSSGKSIASAGRLKTAQYIFAFEGMSQTREGKE